MGKVSKWVAGHRKALAGYAGLGFTVLTLSSQYYHWHLTWLPLAGAVLAAAGVHAIPNKTSS